MERRSGFDLPFVVSLSNRAIRVWRGFGARQLVRESSAAQGLLAFFTKSRYSTKIEVEPIWNGPFSKKP